MDEWEVLVGGCSEYVDEGDRGIAWSVLAIRVYTLGQDPEYGRL